MLPRDLHPRVQSSVVAAESVDLFWFFLLFKLASLVDRTSINFEYLRVMRSDLY